MAMSSVSGCYLMVVVSEPKDQHDKEAILQLLSKGLASWDSTHSGIALGPELQDIANARPEGELFKFGERLVQHSTENVVTEILVNPQVYTFQQCVKNMLTSFTQHRHLIHAGYAFSDNGSWILQDGTFSVNDLLDSLRDPDVQCIAHAYGSSVSVHVHGPDTGLWRSDRLLKDPLLQAANVCINPTPGSVDPGQLQPFLEYIDHMLSPAPLTDLLAPSDIVGSVRFSRPTLYVFPAGQGNSAMFGINGFSVLFDGGFSRRSCCWSFVRHLERLDAVFMTHVNNDNLLGMASILERKTAGATNPQVGHFFANLVESKEENTRHRSRLIVDVRDETRNILRKLKQLSLKPTACLSSSSGDPINLYHKVGHGRLDLYVLSPSKQGVEMKQFVENALRSVRHSRLTLKVRGKEFPIANLVSICCLLCWTPDNKQDTVTRLLLPGSAPQHKILEGLDKLKHLDILKMPVCSAKSQLKARQEKGLDQLIKKTRESSAARKAERPDAAGGGRIETVNKPRARSSSRQSRETRPTKPGITAESRETKPTKTGTTAESRRKTTMLKTSSQDANSKTAGDTSETSKSSVSASKTTTSAANVAGVMEQTPADSGTKTGSVKVKTEIVTKTGTVGKQIHQTEIKTHQRANKGKVDNGMSRASTTAEHVIKTEKIQPLSTSTPKDKLSQRKSRSSKDEDEIEEVRMSGDTLTVTTVPADVHKIIDETHEGRFPDSLEQMSGDFSTELETDSLELRRLEEKETPLYSPTGDVTCKLREHLDNVSAKNGLQIDNQNQQTTPRMELRLEDSAHSFKPIVPALKTGALKTPDEVAELPTDEPMETAFSRENGSPTKMVTSMIETESSQTETDEKTEQSIGKIETQAVTTSISQSADVQPNVEQRLNKGGEPILTDDKTEFTGDQPNQTPPIHSTTAKTDKEQIGGTSEHASPAIGEPYLDYGVQAEPVRETVLLERPEVITIVSTDTTPSPVSPNDALRTQQTQPSGGDGAEKKTVSVSKQEVKSETTGANQTERSSVGENNLEKSSTKQDSSSNSQPSNILTDREEEANIKLPSAANPHETKTGPSANEMESETSQQSSYIADQSDTDDVDLKIDAKTVEPAKSSATESIADVRVPQSDSTKNDKTGEQGRCSTEESQRHNIEGQKHDQPRADGATETKQRSDKTQEQVKTHIPGDKTTEDKNATICESDKHESQTGTNSQSAGLVKVESVPQTLDDKKALPTATKDIISESKPSEAAAPVSKADTCEEKQITKEAALTPTIEITETDDVCSSIIEPGRVVIISEEPRVTDSSLSDNKQTEPGATKSGVSAITASPSVKEEADMAKKENQSSAYKQAEEAVDGSKASKLNEKTTATAGILETSVKVDTPENTTEVQIEASSTGGNSSQLEMSSTKINTATTITPPAVSKQPPIVAPTLEAKTVENVRSVQKADETSRTMKSSRLTEQTAGPESAETVHKTGKPSSDGVHIKATGNVEGKSNIQDAAGQVEITETVEKESAPVVGVAPPLIPGQKESSSSCRDADTMAVCGSAQVLPNISSTHITVQAEKQTKPGVKLEDKEMMMASLDYLVDQIQTSDALPAVPTTSSGTCKKDIEKSKGEISVTSTQEKCDRLNMVLGEIGGDMDKLLRAGPITKSGETVCLGKDDDEDFAMEIEGPITCRKISDLGPVKLSQNTTIEDPIMCEKKEVQKTPKNQKESIDKSPSPGKEQMEHPPAEVQKSTQGVPHSDIEKPIVDELSVAQKITSSVVSQTTSSLSGGPTSSGICSDSTVRPLGSVSCAAKPETYKNEMKDTIVSRTTGGDTVSEFSEFDGFFKEQALLVLGDAEQSSSEREENCKNKDTTKQRAATEQITSMLPPVQNQPAAHSDVTESVKYVPIDIPKATRSSVHSEEPTPPTTSVMVTQAVTSVTFTPPKSTETEDERSAQPDRSDQTIDAAFLRTMDETIRRRSSSELSDIREEAVSSGRSSVREPSSPLDNQEGGHPTHEQSSSQPPTQPQERTCSGHQPQDPPSSRPQKNEISTVEKSVNDSTKPADNPAMTSKDSHLAGTSGVAAGPDDADATHGVWEKPLGLPPPVPPTPPLTKLAVMSRPRAGESPPPGGRRLSNPPPVYLELAYVPHHGNALYAGLQFFQRVRARYYVFSGIEPSTEVFEALMEAKQRWDNQRAEVTIIPTYDTDALGNWFSTNLKRLGELHIDLAPAASRCTVNLQDHDTSCAAYRLEF